MLGTKDILLFRSCVQIHEHLELSEISKVTSSGALEPRGTGDQTEDIKMKISASFQRLGGGYFS